MPKLHDLFYYFRKAWEMGRGYLVFSFLRCFFDAVLSLVDIAGLGVVVSSLSDGAAFADVVQVIIQYVLVNLAIVLTGQGLRLGENLAMRRASNVLQYQYMRDCLDIDYRFVSDGRFVNLKRKSMGGYPVFSINNFSGFFGAAVRLAGVISVFALVSPLFILVLLALSAGIISLTVYSQRCDWRFRLDCAEDERGLGQLYDIMTKYRFAKEIRINDAAGFISGKYRTAFSAHMGKFRALLQRKLGVGWLNILLSCVQSAVMYFYFTYEAAVGAVTVAEYTVAVASTALFVSSVLSLFKYIGQIRNTLDSVGILREYEAVVRENSVIRDTKDSVEAEIEAATAVLRFENVSFRYPDGDGAKGSGGSGGADCHGDHVLKNITFSLEPGQKMAVVGLNGAGKTTLIKLILRLYKPTEGRITFGGVDIFTIPYGQYVGLLSVVLQDFALFAYSVRENIVFDGAADDLRVAEAVEKSGLSEKADSLPRGLDTSVGRELDDFGVEFSGGEGQKLSSARAIYRDGAVFILDEPTSALDPFAEAAFFRRLGEITRGKSTIFITHRLSSTVFCDEILVLDGGRVIESGSHDELMAVEDGVYAGLYRAQMKFYEDGAAREVQ